MRRASLNNASQHKRVTADAYRRWSHVWDFAKYTNRSIYDAVQLSLDGRHGKVLDVGCGTGLMAAQLLGRGHEVVGVDLSSAMIAKAKRALSARAGLLVADAEHLPFVDGRFDAVVNLISLHHYPDAGRAIAEFRRLLRPGGRLVLVAFDRDSLYIRLAQRMNRRITWLAGKSWQKTKAEVLALTKDSGFTSIKVRPVPYAIKTFVIVAE